MSWPNHWAHLREIEVSDDEEEEGAGYEDIVVVLLDVGKSTRSSLGDYRDLSAVVIMVDLFYLRATLTMKWEAAARPMTLLRRAMGKTSAPYSHVVLFNMPS